MAINGVVNNALSVYAQSTKKTVSQTESTEQTQELSEAEKLEAFKKEIWNQINSYPWDSVMNISIQITDGAFQRMMEDSDFKDEMLDVLYRVSLTAHPPGHTCLEWISESGYKGFAYLDDDAGEVAFKAHSNHKDSFYVHKAKKKSDSVDLAEYYEKQRRERELQQELRDKEYFQHKELTEYWNKRQSAAASYEANIMAEPAESSGFDSMAAGTNT